MKKITLIIFISLIFCVGCSDSGNRNSEDSDVEVVLAKTDSTISEAVDQRYIDFIKAKEEYDEEEDISIFAKEDIDLDGVDEIIIGCGHIDDDPILSYISKLYILRDKAGMISQVGENLAEGGYAVYEVKLINIQNQPQKYIYCGVTNSANLTGFELIELADNQPKVICYSASATGAGEDRLLDSDEDGQFDSYEQNRWSYDVLYYPQTTTYKWVSNDFVLDNTYVEMPEYPESIENVIIEYVALKYLEEGKSLEIDERLAELCTFENKDFIDMTLDMWRGVIYNTVMDFDGKMEFKIEVNENRAKAKIQFIDENNQTYAYLFSLSKSSGRWQIISIE